MFNTDYTFPLLNPSGPSGHYMITRFNLLKLCILPTQFAFMFSEWLGFVSVT
jgi:hypothetical protein